MLFCSADKSHQLGLKFELVMELRPRVASAVLLHARSSEQFFTLYIHQGAVSLTRIQSYARVWFLPEDDIEDQLNREKNRV